MKSIKIEKNRRIICNLCLQNLMRVVMKVCLLKRMRRNQTYSNLPEIEELSVQDVMALHQKLCLYCLNKGLDLSHILSVFLLPSLKRQLLEHSSLKEEWIHQSLRTSFTKYLSISELKGLSKALVLCCFLITHGFTIIVGSLLQQKQKECTYFSMPSIVLGSTQLKHCSVSLREESRLLKFH